MTNTTLSLKGIFPPLPTSFDRDENLAPAKIKENIQKLSSFGLSGFLILGSNGELVMLSHDEKVAAFEAAREAITPDKVMLAGTGCDSTRQTIRLTQAAAQAGADAALVLNPFYYKGLMNREALRAHYFAVADAATIPVIIYNMPANTGLDMDADTILALGEHPNIIGVKDSGGNVVKMGEIVGRAKPGFQVLAGSAGFLLPALSVGAVGGILASANIAPAQCLEIYRAWQQGDMQKAMAAQHMIIPINTAVTSKWGVPALKAAMDHLGLYGGPARKPILPLAENNRQQLVNTISELTAF